MKVNTRFIAGSLMIALLSACTSGAAERRQANPDFDYVDTQPLKKWQQPADSKVEFNGQYNIPKGNYIGGIAEQVDIRPPQQVLELIPGARIEEQEGVVTAWLSDEKSANKLWQTMLILIEKRNIDIILQTDTRIETDWFSWQSEDEDYEFAARYDIDKRVENNRHGVQVSLVDWQVDGKNAVATQANKKRYNVLMTNLFASAYDDRLREEARIRAEELVRRIPITMGQDRSGLPIIIARAPYDVFWERTSELLPAMGLIIDERNRSQGSIKVKYTNLGRDFWQELAVKPPKLTDSTYHFILGDLGNRTSINIANAAGKPVDEAVLKSIASAFSAMIEKSNKQPKQK